MEVQTAMNLLEQVIYKAGWQFRIEDHTARFEGTVLVHVVYPAKNSDREEAPDYEGDVEGGARASFPIVVGDILVVETLYRRMFDRLMEIEQHEAREFFRVLPSLWAPFHPHNLGGMERFGEGVDRDLTFGIA